MQLNVQSIVCNLITHLLERPKIWIASKHGNGALEEAKVGIPMAWEWGSCSIMAHHMNCHVPLPWLCNFGHRRKGSHSNSLGKCVLSTWQLVPFSPRDANNVPRNDSSIPPFGNECIISSPCWINIHNASFVDSIFFTHYGHFDGHFERQYMHTATITKMQTVYGNFSIFFFKNECMVKATQRCVVWFPTPLSPSPFNNSSME